MATVIQVRRDTAAAWTAVGNTVTLASGEIGYETDTGNMKIGNGSSLWNALAYYQLPNVSVVSNFDLNHADYRKMGRYLLKTTSDTWTNTPAAATGFTAASGNCVMLSFFHDDSPSVGTLPQYVSQQLTQFLSSGAVARTWYRVYDGTNWTAWTRHATLQTDGRLGIGTTSAQSLLHVAGGDVTISTGADITAVNQVLGQVNFRSDDASTGASGTFGQISVKNETAGAWSAASDADTYMSLSTSADGTMAERLRITSTGRVGIGVTPTSRNLTVKDASTGVAFQLLNSATGDTAADGFVITQTSANTSILNQESGTLTIGTNNATSITLESSGNNVTIAGDLTVSGGDIVGAATTNIAAAATTVGIANTATAAQTINLATGATVSGSTKAVNIGTNGANGSTTNVTLGSTTGTSTVAIQGAATVSGATTTTGLVTANGGVTIPNGQTLTVNGAFALAGDTIQTSEIADSAVTSAKIASAAVTSAKMATDSVATASIVGSAVTYAKIQNVSTTDRLLGRSSAGAGDVEEITCTAAGRALLDDANAAAQRTTLGLTEVSTATNTEVLQFKNQVNGFTMFNVPVNSGNTTSGAFTGVTSTSTAFNSGLADALNPLGNFSLLGWSKVNVGGIYYVRPASGTWTILVTAGGGDRMVFATRTA